MTSKNFRISIKSNTAELQGIRKAVTEFIADSLDKNEAARIVLAIDEVLSNIIIHGYGNDYSGEIVMEMEFDGSKLKFIISDNAPLFNPLECPSPDIDEYFNTGKSGGLGVDIYKKIMDVYYEKNEPCGNRLIMVKPVKKQYS